MPAKNARKQYVTNGYYHIYNRGVEKRKIFQKDFDYQIFLFYLKTYLVPKDINKLQERLNSDISYKERDKILREIKLNNFSEDISLLAFCLMPNHYHFLVQQNSASAIDSFINSLGTRYTMYFNKKYKRVGHLYQGVYKAVLIKNDEYLLQLSKYIHFQAAVNKKIPQPSSYEAYLGLTKPEWINTKLILSFFNKSKPNSSYKNFVESNSNFSLISNYLLEKY